MFPFIERLGIPSITKFTPRLQKHPCFKFLVMRSLLSSSENGKLPPPFESTTSFKDKSTHFNKYYLLAPVPPSHVKR